MSPDNSSREKEMAGEMAGGEELAGLLGHSTIGRSRGRRFARTAEGGVEKTR